MRLHAASARFEAGDSRCDWIEEGIFRTREAVSDPSADRRRPVDRAVQSERETAARQERLDRAEGQPRIDLDELRGFVEREWGAAYDRARELFPMIGGGR